MNSIILAIFLSLIIAVVQGACPFPSLEQQWQSFQSELNKTYATPEEAARRFEIFKNNSDYINEHNNDNNSTFTLALNEYADLTIDEYNALYSSYYQNTSSSSSSHRKKRQSSIINSILDMLDNDKRKQSCDDSWAFATVKSIEVALANSTGLYVQLSIQQILDCVGGGCYSGYTPTIGDVFKYVARNGIESELVYPYIGAASGGKCNYNPLLIITKLYGYVDLQGQNDLVIENALSVAGTIVGFVAPINIDWQFYSSGVLKLPAIISNRKRRQAWDQVPGQYLEISVRGDELWSIQGNSHMPRFDPNSGKWTVSAKQDVIISANPSYAFGYPVIDNFKTFGSYQHFVKLVNA